MFLLVLAYPGSPGPMAVKRLCVCVTYYLKPYTDAPEVQYLITEIANLLLVINLYALCRFSCHLCCTTNITVVHDTKPRHLLYIIHLCSCSTNTTHSFIVKSYIKHICTFRLSVR